MKTAEEIAGSPVELYTAERVFNRGDASAPPSLGVSFSGGGNRSAAFAIGVLRALHAHGTLGKIDVISAVSGGSYALSWLLLQPYYHRDSHLDPRGAIERIQTSMFDLEGPFQRHLVDNAKPFGARNWTSLVLESAINLPIDIVLLNGLRLLSLPFSSGKMASQAANLRNAQSSIRRSYREGIQRTYHVFPDPQYKPTTESQSLLNTSFIAAHHLDLTRPEVPPVSFPTLTEFARQARLPSFVFNATVRPPRPGQGTPLCQRIFELGPMGLGADSCGYLKWSQTGGLGWEPGEHGSSARRPSPFATIRNFNVAPAISGAALSGTNLDDSRARWLLNFLNMGWEYVVPSPADGQRIVRLSDGGHSENLGAYALLRRKCRTILVVDAEHDPNYGFGAYRTLKDAAGRELRTDIRIPELDRVLDGSGKFDPRHPVHEGTVTFLDDDDRGRIFYLKLSMHRDLLGEYSQVINAYSTRHPSFPQQPTSDQYFEPAQFTAYRALGYAIADPIAAGLVDC